MRVAVIPYAKTLAPPFPITTVSKPASIVRKKAVAVDWFNERRKEGKCFTVVITFPAALSPFGTNRSPLTVRNAVLNTYLKNQRKNEVLFSPVLRKDAGI